MVKIKGLRKAVGERNNWIKRGYFRVANIMLDTSNGKIWSDCFLTNNEWRIYKSDSVVNINHICHYYNMPLTMMGIKVALVKAMDDDIIPYLEIGGKIPYVE